MEHAAFFLFKKEELQKRCLLLHRRRNIHGYKDIINKSMFNNPIFVTNLFIQLYFGGEPLTEIQVQNDFVYHVLVGDISEAYKMIEGQIEKQIKKYF